MGPESHWFLPSLIRFSWPRGEEEALIARPLLPSLPSGLHPISVLSIEGGEQGTRCPAGRRWGRRALGRCSRRSTTTTRGAPAALTTGGRTSSGECRTRSSSMSGWFLSRPVHTSLPYTALFSSSSSCRVTFLLSS